MDRADAADRCHARQAVVVHDVVQGQSEERLLRILDLFGVPAESKSLAQLGTRTSARGDYAVFAAADTLAAARGMPQAAATLREAGAIYLYAAEDRSACEAALVALGLPSHWRVRPAPPGPLSVRVGETWPGLTGPMRGLTLAIPLTRLDSIVAMGGRADEQVAAVISADEHPIFLSFELDGVPAFFNASAIVVDVDDASRKNYYDVKDHFASVVPLLTFLRWAFASVMWRPNELGACLVIDDPLLRPRYGFCDFRQLRDLMSARGFTTNVAFIPWNWRRTTRRNSSFFREHSASFSVSIHGCDHIAAEFGALSAPLLERRARLALTRMQRHQERTGIQHDKVMVFPQGVFSSICPQILKRNGFVAAINTEISPIDGPATLIRDAWDTAILSHGGFPIYTRRYAHHGVENFAFDLLLGKPCFIVAHHDFFKDEGAALGKLISRLGSLSDSLRWRSPLEVIRRAYRQRDVGEVRQIEMYGSEIVVANTGDRTATQRITKREVDPRAIVDVQVDGQSVPWETHSGHLTLGLSLAPRTEALVSVSYVAPPPPRADRQSLNTTLAIAGRRILSELRDEGAYLARVVSR